MQIFKRLVALVCHAVLFMTLAACGGGDDDGGKVCTIGKACGDTCIAANLTCHQ